MQVYDIIMFFQIYNSNKEMSKERVVVENVEGYPF